MQILEFYHKDQKSPESVQRFEINNVWTWVSDREQDAGITIR